MISSSSGGSGVDFIEPFDGLLAFDLEALGIGIGRPTLEDLRPLRVLRGSGDSCFARFPAQIGVSTSTESGPEESLPASGSASSSLRRFLVIGPLMSFFREFVGVGVLRNMVRQEK
jgi:hypothetical protein